MEEEQQSGLEGLRIVSFESRRAREMAELIRRYGGDPIIAPSLREIPLSENKAALDFVRRLEAGEIDVVILLTGVGTRTLVEAVASEYPPDKLAAALGRAALVARGPKPVAALKELGLQPTVTIPEPNTWREILSELDLKTDVRGRQVAVQEYGITNTELIAGLEARGAKVTRVAVYRWGLPEDTGPLRSALRELIDGRADIALFTNATQVDHVFKVATEDRLDQPLRDVFRRVLIASIGPVCSEALEYFGLKADLEPDHPKMGHLIATVARRGRTLLEKKRARSRQGVEVKTAAPAPGRQLSPFLAACRREKTPFTPVWLMRQAGRYMEEYRKLRAEFGFLDLCKQPDLAAEITVTPVARLGVDAAIVFADILLLLEPMGVGLEYGKDNGPQIRHPVRSRADVDRLRDFAPEKEFSFVYDAVRKSCAELKGKVPLIGFSGAPFTLASYLIEGGTSRNFLQTKRLMYSDSGAWRALMERISRGVVGYLNGQIAAGAEAVQLFDSWAGCLAPEDYREHVLPHTRAVIAEITPNIPVIHFSTGTSGLLKLVRSAGGEVIGIDWRVSLDEAWECAGYDVGIQGNLDPAALFAPAGEIRRRVAEILRRAAGRPGHIFNLGHGVLPDTPVENVIQMVQAVHELSAR